MGKDNQWDPATQSFIRPTPEMLAAQQQSGPPVGRTFETGAYRDTEANKLDYEAFLSPLVLRRYAQYMHKNRRQSDGNIRDGDNWQKGIPLKVYWKSAWRHFMDVWTYHRTTSPLTPSGESLLEEALCALLFNIQGYLFELLKKKENHANRTVQTPLSARVDP